MAEHIILLDGAMGTLLLSSGFNPKGFPETMNLAHPDLVTKIHRSYIEAGAEIVYANTIGANGKKAEQTGFCVREVVEAGIENARKACGKNTRVALDIGPIGELLEPYGALEEAQAYDLYSEMIDAGKGADLIVLETMLDLHEVLIAVKAARDLTALPVFATMSFTISGKTIMGVTPEQMVEALEDAGVAALGINCSLGPREAYPVMERLSRCAKLPMIVKPNAGMPDPKTGAYRVTPMEFAEELSKIVGLGVRYMGGCCGTNPEFIKALRYALTGEKQLLQQEIAPNR
jgi:5-methyltetrahydrofolate--homocysteine methyltransferase